MAEIIRKGKLFFSMIANGYIMEMFKILKKKTYSNDYFFMIKRDLSKEIKIPPSRINLSIRPYKESDHKYFPNLPEDDRMLSENIDTCYVALTEEGIPCYRHWLIYPSQNEKMKKYFGDNLPLLKEGECMLERAFTIPEFRSKYVMPAASSMLANMAKNDGYKWVITCTHVDNIPTLKGAVKCDAVIYELQTIKWRFFKKSVTYSKVPEKFKTNPQLFPEQNLKTSLAST